MTDKNILYQGELCVARLNPTIAYVIVDGLKRHIKIEGFVNRS